MSDCLFCKILAGDVPSDIVYENEHVVAFKDIYPKTPFHVLIIPKRHIATLNDLEADDAELAGQLFLAAKAIAMEQGFAEAGYRVQMNCGEGGGQVVFHMHLHLMAGKKFSD
ncbi:MAG: histidine triad nucleotide-binding protein [Proteobacteria bacterium]|nr:MAG: histidine triad nucleotide-binding protein [Pseudomonadota bacterium]